jgi:hypothetical protein
MRIWNSLRLRADNFSGHAEIHATENHPLRHRLQSTSDATRVVEFAKYNALDLEPAVYDNLHQEVWSAIALWRILRPGLQHCIKGFDRTIDKM